MARLVGAPAAISRWEAADRVPSGKTAAAYAKTLRRLELHRAGAGATERLVYRVDEVAEVGCGRSTVYDAISRDELGAAPRLRRRVLMTKWFARRSRTYGPGRTRTNELVPRLHLASAVPRPQGGRTWPTRGG